MTTDRHRRPLRGRRRLGPRAAASRAGRRGAQRAARRRPTPAPTSSRRPAGRSPSSTPAELAEFMHGLAEVARSHRPGRQLRRARLRDRHHRSRTRRAHADASRSARPRSAPSCCSSSSSGPRCPTNAPRRCSADERLAFARHHLRSARRYRPHLLTEPEEVVLTEKSVTGRSAWQRLFEEQVSAIEVAARRRDDDARGRARAAARARPRGTPRPRPKRSPTALRARAAHARRSCSTRCWPTRRSTTGCATTTAGSRAATSPTRRATSRCRRSSTRCSGRYSIPQRWYALKAQLLGHRPARRLRPDGVGRRRRGRDRLGRGARTLVLDAYGSFSGELADTARRFFDGAWIDAPARPGQATGRVLRVHGAVAPPVRAAELDRRAGATCSRSRTSSATACTRTSRASRASSTRRRRSRWPRPRRCSARRSRSGGCSSEVTDPQERLALLASNLEDQIATVFRQIAMNRFEDAIHNARRERGRARRSTASASCGPQSQYDDARRLGRDHRGLPHVVVVHPALHRDARLRVRVRVRPAARAVGVRAVRGAGRRLRAAVPRPVARGRLDGARRSSASSSTSTSPTPGSGTAASTSSSAASTRRSKRPRGRGEVVMTLPRHPVEHRQRRRGPRCGASSAIPSSSWPACGCTRPTRPGKDAGELCGLAAGRRARDERRRRAARARRRLRVVHRDRRPAPDRRDHRHGAHPARRARTSCRARSWPRSGRCTSSRRCARRSKTRARPAGVSCFTSGIDPGWANDILPLLLTGTCENVEHLRVMEIVNYKHYEQPTVLFETMGFGKALDAQAAAVDPRRAVVRVGRRR